MSAWLRANQLFKLLPVPLSFDGGVSKLGIVKIEELFPSTMGRQVVVLKCELVKIMICKVN